MALKAIIGLTESNRPHYERYREQFSKEDDKTLAGHYFREMKTGVTGVPMQAIYLLALRDELTSRFGDSPIEYDGVVLEL